ncbi:MAG: hypothetical protein ACTSUP_01905 [Candidatus Heimdallarchaeaceae archaeon]
MQSQDIEGISNAEYLREKYPCYNYAIHFLESEEITRRRLGYALLAPLFRTLPEEIKELIRYVWQNDTEKGKIPYSFVKCCKAIFMGEE